MPIVSEHPRSLEVIRTLSEDCDSDLDTFMQDYQERRTRMRKEAEGRRKLVKHLEGEDRDDLHWRELVSLISEREESLEELRDELVVMGKELMLLKREMRRARKRLLDGQVDIEESLRDTSRTYRPAGSDAELTYSGRDGARRTWETVKPWLKGFLPSSS